MRKVYCDHCGKILISYFPKDHARKDIGKTDDLICLDEQENSVVKDKNTSLFDLVMLTIEDEFDLCGDCREWLDDSISYVIKAYFKTQEINKIKEESENGTEETETTKTKS